MIILHNVALSCFKYTYYIAQKNDVKSPNSNISLIYEMLGKSVKNAHSHMWTSLER